MSNEAAIHEMSPGSAGPDGSPPASRGYYAINTDGYIVLVAPGSSLPANLRLATAAEVSRARQLANPITEAPPVADAWVADGGV